MTITPRRKRLLLIAGFVLALAITLFFGFRLVRRIVNRPTFEPIRSWMDLGYVGRAYGVPPRVLEDALGLTPSKPPKRQTIAEIATSQGKTSNEVIKTLEDAIAKARPPRPPPPGSTPIPPPTATNS